MISQRRGYSFSDCETRLVEFLGDPQRLPNDTSRRSTSRNGEKSRTPVMRAQQSARPAENWLPTLEMPKK
jgi:hypothetical protein